MPRVVMYATRSCPYCFRARLLLDQKGVDYQEIAVDGDPALREEMERLSGRSTVPQIFIDGRAVGGFVDLLLLERGGELDQLLSGGAPATQG